MMLTFCLFRNVTSPYTTSFGLVTQSSRQRASVYETMIVPKACQLLPKTWRMGAGTCISEAINVLKGSLCEHLFFSLYPFLISLIIEGNETLFHCT